MIGWFQNHFSLAKYNTMLMKHRWRSGECAGFWLWMGSIPSYLWHFLNLKSAKLEKTNHNIILKILLLQKWVIFSKVYIEIIFRFSINIFSWSKRTSASRWSSPNFSTPTSRRCGRTPKPKPSWSAHRSDRKKRNFVPQKWLKSFTYFFYWQSRVHRFHIIILRSFFVWIKMDIFVHFFRKIWKF